MQPSHSYEITGWAKGVAIDANSRCQFTLGFYKPDTGGQVTYPGRSLLDDLLNRCLTFGTQQGVPMAVSEFGLTRACFDNGRGGLNWLSDMVNVLDDHALSYVFFTYHNDSMGIYGDESKLPDPSTKISAITDFFRQKLVGDAGAN